MRERERERTRDCWFCSGYEKEKEESKYLSVRASVYNVRTREMVMVVFHGKREKESKRMPVNVFRMGSPRGWLGRGCCRLVCFGTSEEVFHRSPENSGTGNKSCRRVEHAMAVGHFQEHAHCSQGFIEWREGPFHSSMTSVFSGQYR